MSEEITKEVKKALALSEDLQNSVDDVFKKADRPFRWLTQEKIIFRVSGVVEYLAAKGIVMTGDTIRAYTKESTGHEKNRLEEALSKSDIDRKVCRRKQGGNRVRYFTRAEADLLSQL